MRIIFAGTPEFAAQHLQLLMGDDCSHEIIAVYTQPDRPAGRGKKLAASSVKMAAKGAGVPIYQPVSLKDSDQHLILANLKPDLFIVVAYGLILPAEILNIPKYGCINVHASLLPRWRGAAPIQRAIEAGDRQTGITIMQMDAGLDTGNILGHVKCTIDNNETGGSLLCKMSTIGPPLLLRTISEVEQETAISIKQNDALCTYAKKIDKKELLLDWSISAENLFRKILAFNPFQIMYTTLNNDRIRIWGAELSTVRESVAPGTIINTSNDGILVTTGKGCILITELQMPGKNRLKASEILHSKSKLFSPGSIFGGKGSL